MLPNVVQSASSWLLFFSALVGAIAALFGGALGYYIQNRGVRRIAREERSWQRKAETYVDLIGLMHRMAVELGIYDADYLVQGGPVSPVEIPPVLAARLRAFGSEEVRNKLKNFWAARDEYRYAADDAAKRNAKDHAETSITDVESQVRTELNP